MSASAHARLLLMGLWCEAHDDGVFEWKPLTLKARIFPVDAVDVPALLAELVELSFVQRFEASGKPYGAIRNFRKYQRPKKPNSSGVLPADLQTYVAISEQEYRTGSGEYGTGGGKSPQMEDGGGRGDDEDLEEPNGSSDGRGPSNASRFESRDALIAQSRADLLGMGVAKSDVKPLIGKWLADVSDDHAAVLEAITRARDQCPHDPVAWITARLKGHSNEHAPRKSEIMRAFARLDERLESLG